MRKLLVAVVAAVALLPSSSWSQQAGRAEARALWVTRFDYDSPSKIAQIMEKASRAHFNIIYFQARAASDAYYRSTIEPCAAILCGKLGGTPSYDPLEVAVREGHKRGLQVHAYLNVPHRLQESRDSAGRWLSRTQEIRVTCFSIIQIG